MRRLVVFNQVTLDGYFAGENGDISWLHQDYKDLEWKKFVEENAIAEAWECSALLRGGA